MNTCPACSQPVSPNDLACPKCGITLHHGTATAGPTSGGSGRGLSVVAIVVIGLVGIVVLVGCLGIVGTGLLFGFRSSSVMSSPSTPPPPAPVSAIPMVEEVSVEESVTTPSGPTSRPPVQLRGEQPVSDQPAKTR